jgi:hypothetical protein
MNGLPRPEKEESGDGWGRGTCVEESVPRPEAGVAASARVAAEGTCGRTRGTYHGAGAWTGSCAGEEGGGAADGSV